MAFKKLHPAIQEKLTSLEIETPTAFQNKSIPDPFTKENW